jgi:two-component system OmpR family sensor kinase
MMKSLSSRLVVTAVLLVAVVSLLIGTTTTLAMRNYLNSRLDEEVSSSIKRFTEPPNSDDPGGGDQQRIDPRNLGPGTLICVLGDSAQGEVLSDTPGDNLTVSSSALEKLADVPVDDHVHAVDLPAIGSYRVIAAETTVVTNNGPSTVTLVTGLPADDVESTLASLMWWEALLGLLGVVAAALVGTLLVRRQLAPLREVAATAHEVAAMPLDSGEVDLSPRVSNPDGDTEVGQVGAALNALLAHVETSLSARHRSEQQVRQFVADASHELRTPLSTIRGYAELSRRTPDDAAALSSSWAKVSTEADRMSSLVDDLLLLARLDSGRPLAREPVDVTRLLLEAVGDARVVGPDHQWRLELPEDPLEVTGDEQRLHQVVTNLLTNARRHTPAGTTVQVAAQAVSGMVEVLVADDGPGFPPDLAQSAFERFTRGDAARTRSSGGVGLGLSIVAAIIRAHGGDVRLSSEPGATRIVVRIPVVRIPKDATI